jgi:hypothetical protein
VSRAPAALLVLLAAGCGPRAPAPPPDKDRGTAAPSTLEEARGRSPRPGLFSGCYDTSFGPMLLLENTDGTVMGSYVHGDGELAGRIEGQAILFRWHEKDTGAKGAGYFLSRPDGAGVVGRWGYGESIDAGGAWTGKRFSSDVEHCE